MAYDNLSYRSRPLAPKVEIPPFPSPPLIRSSSSLSRVQRRLRTLSSLMVKTIPESRPEEDAHGAYGLNLLSEPSEPHLDFIFVSSLAIFYSTPSASYITFRVPILTRQRLLRSTDSVAVQERHGAVHPGLARSGQRNGCRQSRASSTFVSTVMDTTRTGPRPSRVISASTTLVRLCWPTCITRLTCARTEM